MRASITFRLLLLTNLLVLATVGAVAVVASRISAAVVEQRLVQDTALQTARFLQSTGLPPSDRMMLNLRQIFGNHFAVARTSDESILGTSFSPEVGADLRQQLRPDDQVYDVSVHGVDYRVGSHSVRRTGGSGNTGEELRLFVLMPSAELAQTGQLAWSQTLVAAAPAIVVATLLGLGLSLTIIKPIRKLAREMDRITASQGEVALSNVTSQAGPPERAGVELPRRGGPSEVAQLATSFDRLLARLADVQDELICSQRLAALGKVAASAAHELKNPLSSIRMHLRLLQDEPMSDSRQDDIDMLVREVERMDLYLQELTDVAAGGVTETGAHLVVPGSVEEIDLSETVASVMRLLEGRCQHAGVTLQYDYHAKSPRVLAAPSRLRQVLMNLGINAIEAMPGGGSMTIRTQPMPSGRVRLSVADSGEGIRAAPPERVFDLFFSTKDHSSGLGLYITRQLVLAQGGEIGCENTGKGALFWVELPATQDGDTSPAQDSEKV